MLSRDKALFMDHPLRWENIAGDALLECYRSFKPDLLFFIHEPAYGQYGARVLEKISVPKIGWYVEPFENLPRLRSHSQYFDIYNSFHMNAVKKLADEHINAQYLCHAVSPNRFYPLDSVTGNYDVCFVGNYSEYRDEVISAVLEVTGRVALYGPNWIRKSKIDKDTLLSIHKGDRIYGEDLNILYNSSSVVLGASRIPGTAGLNMRFFEALAAKACFLTDASPELDLHFARDRHLVVFDNPGDLKGKLKQLLGDPALRKQIAGAGYAEVMARHTYKQMAERIVAQFHSLTNFKQGEKP